MKAENALALAITIYMQEITEQTSGTLRIGLTTLYRSIKHLLAGARTAFIAPFYAMIETVSKSFSPSF